MNKALPTSPNTASAGPPPPPQEEAPPPIPYRTDSMPDGANVASTSVSTEPMDVVDVTPPVASVSNPFGAFQTGWRRYKAVKGHG